MVKLFGTLPPQLPPWTNKIIDGFRWLFAAVAIVVMVVVSVKSFMVSGGAEAETAVPMTAQPRQEPAPLLNSYRFRPALPQDIEKVINKAETPVRAASSSNPTGRAVSEPDRPIRQRNTAQAEKRIPPQRDAVAESRPVTKPGAQAEAQRKAQEAKRNAKKLEAARVVGAERELRSTPALASRETSKLITGATDD